MRVWNFWPSRWRHRFSRVLHQPATDGLELSVSFACLSLRPRLCQAWLQPNPQHKSRHLLVNLCGKNSARGGATDRPFTCHPRRGMVPLPSPTFAASLFCDTNVESSAVLVTRSSTHTTTHTLLSVFSSLLSDTMEPAVYSSGQGTRSAAAPNNSSHEKSCSLSERPSLSTVHEFQK